MLQAPDGALLAIGWLLDPLRRVERALLKSTANLYAQLDADWCPLPRPDLARGFAQDPRFADLLDERDAMHGFIAHAPAQREQVAGAEVYLELVLEDGSCLFRPLAVTPFESAERLPQLLRRSRPTEPELAPDRRGPPRARSSRACRRPRAGPGGGPADPPRRAGAAAR